MWWHQQFQAWQEILFGLCMLLAGLLLEFGIDVWRDRYLRRQAYKERHSHDADIGDLS